MTNFYTEMAGYVFNLFTLQKKWNYALKHPLKKLLFLLQWRLATRYTDKDPTMFILICSTQLLSVPTSAKRSYHLSSSGSSSFVMNANVSTITLPTNIDDLQQYKGGIVS